VVDSLMLLARADSGTENLDNAVMYISQGMWANRRRLDRFQGFGISPSRPFGSTVCGSLNPGLGELSSRTKFLSLLFS
jgi:hypothetical protein